MAEIITVELSFVKDAPTYVVGLDKRKFERAFEKSTHPYRIKDGTLFVEVDRRLWERRMARTPVVKPSRQKAKSDTVKRKCLICKHEFKDQPQMRICAPCKRSANWQDGDYGL